MCHDVFVLLLTQQKRKLFSFAFRFDRNMCVPSLYINSGNQLTLPYFGSLSAKGNISQM